jgi:hypothetical protein
MCVIIAVEENAEDVSLVEWQQAASVHDDGYGIAWFEDNKVRYIKRTAQADDLADFRPPKPYVMHFRLATQGDAITKLCHPFVIGHGSPLRKKGSAKKVLFHNGHVADWEDFLIQATRGRLPNGPYSDSRAIAMAVHSLGPAILQLPRFHAERFLIMNATDHTLDMFGGWEYGTEDEIWRSNTWHRDYMHWCDAHPYLGADTCMEMDCKLPTDEDSFLYCTKHKRDSMARRIDKHCTFCHCILGSPESISTGLCTSCREASCVQCGFHLTELELREREAYCNKCKSNLYINCKDCGKPLEKDSPYSQCDTCLIETGDYVFKQTKRTAVYTAKKR